MQTKTSTKRKRELKRDTKYMPRLTMDQRKNQRRLLQKNKKTSSRLSRRRKEESTAPEEVEAAEAVEEAVEEEVATSKEKMTIRERGSPSLKRQMRSLRMLTWRERLSPNSQRLTPNPSPPRNDPKIGVKPTSSECYNSE